MNPVVQSKKSPSTNPRICALKDGAESSPIWGGEHERSLINHHLATVDLPGEINPFKWVAGIFFPPL